VAYTKAHRHPELGDQTICEVYGAERSKLVPMPAGLMDSQAVPASVVEDLPGLFRQQQVLGGRQCSG
jgi:hypothetical protein